MLWVRISHCSASEDRQDAARAPVTCSASQEQARIQAKRHAGKKQEQQAATLYRLAYSLVIHRPRMSSFGPCINQCDMAMRLSHPCPILVQIEGALCEEVLPMGLRHAPKSLVLPLLVIARRSQHCH
jgi:hypothetical protein